MGSKYLDKSHSDKLERQSAELENHGDRETASDPNAMGPAMRTPYTAVSPMFVDSDGVDQTWNEGQSVDGADYSRDSRFPRNGEATRYKGALPDWLGKRGSK